jgi:putative Mg2+ transporter-C (MgtC) family protein
MWWERVGSTLQREFSDLGNVEDLTIVVLRLFVAMLLGGASPRAGQANLPTPM